MFRRYIRSAFRMAQRGVEATWVSQRSDLRALCPERAVSACSSATDIVEHNANPVHHTTPHTEQLLITLRAHISYAVRCMCSQVYGLALYVERQTAAAELARLNSEGFFADGNYGVERMCAAIAALKCNKASPLQSNYS